MAIIGAAWARLAGEAAELEVSANQDGERGARRKANAAAARREADAQERLNGKQVLRLVREADSLRMTLENGGQGQASGAVSFSWVVARAKRYQMSQAGTVQRKRFEEILTKQISMSVARMRRARAARTLRERVA